MELLRKSRPSVAAACTADPVLLGLIIVKGTLRSGSSDGAAHDK